jgi:hypothetical protein
MFLLAVVLSVYNDQAKHGQAIQLPKETWTENTTTKGNMDRQYNDQKKTMTGNTTTKRNMDRHLSMFLLVVVLPVHVSFGRFIVCPFFLWSLYCLSMFPLVVVPPTISTIPLSNLTVQQ